MRRWPRLALALLAASGPAFAQEIASYRIRVTYDGTAGPHVLPSTRTCPGATPKNGAIVVEGDVYGDESLIAEDGIASYVGCGDATWDVDVCDLRDAGSEGSKHCVTGIAGSAKMQFEVEINSDRDGAYIKMQPVPGTVSLRAGGTCPSSLTAEVRQLHSTTTEVAEIESVPAGKLQVRGHYRSGTGDNHWTLDVLPDAADPLAYPGGPNDACGFGKNVPYQTGTQGGDPDDGDPDVEEDSEDELNPLDPDAPDVEQELAPEDRE